MRDDDMPTIEELVTSTATAGGERTDGLSDEAVVVPPAAPPLRYIRWRLVAGDAKGLVVSIAPRPP